MMENNLVKMRWICLTVILGVLLSACNFELQIEQPVETEVAVRGTSISSEERSDLDVTAVKSLTLQPTTVEPTSAWTFPSNWQELLRGRQMIEPGNVGQLHEVAFVAGEGSFEVTPDSSILALILTEGIRLYELGTFQEVASFDFAVTYGQNYDLASDSQHFAWQVDQDTVQIWDLKAGDILTEFNGFSPGDSLSVQFSPDADQVLVVDAIGAKVFDLASGESGIERASVRSAYFSPDGPHVVIVDNGGEVQIVDAKTGEIVLTSADAMEVHFSPDSKKVAFVSGVDFKVEIWDLESRTQLTELSGYTTAAPFYYVIFSPDWETMFWMSRASLQPMGVTTGNLGPEFIFSGNVTFSPVGDLWGGVEEGWYGDTYQGQVKLVDLDSWQEVAILMNGGRVSDLAFSPDGRILAVAVEGAVNLWDVARQERVVTIEGIREGVSRVEFSRDGRLLFLGSQEGVSVLSVQP